MSTTITADNAGTVLRSAVYAAKSEIPTASSFAHPGDIDSLRKIVEDAYDRVWDKILDCYELSATIRDKSPLAFLLDPDGTAVGELENAEKLLRQALDQENNERVVKVIQAAIDILQNLRWEIMVNDGLAEDGGTTIYKDGKSFMASMGL